AGRSRRAGAGARGARCRCYGCTWRSPWREAGAEEPGRVDQSAAVRHGRWRAMQVVDLDARVPTPGSEARGQTRAQGLGLASADASIDASALTADASTGGRQPSAWEERPWGRPHRRLRRARASVSKAQVAGKAGEVVQPQS